MPNGTGIKQQEMEELDTSEKRMAEYFHKVLSILFEFCLWKTGVLMETSVWKNHSIRKLMSTFRQYLIWVFQWIIILCVISV